MQPSRILVAFAVMGACASPAAKPDGGQDGGAGAGAAGTGAAGTGAAGTGAAGTGTAGTGAAGTGAAGTGVAGTGAAGTGAAGAGAAGIGAAGTGAAGAAAFDLSKVNCFAKGDGKTTVALVNHCRAHVTFGGSNNQSGELEPEQFACRDVGNATVELPAIRYWGFTTPDPGLGHHTLAEFTFNTTFNDFDWYNISHVDAQNLPMQIVAAAMPKCRTLTCADSLLPGCPAVGQYKSPAGDVTACVSPLPNDPQSPVAQYFDKACPDAYSWSGDDSDSVVACAGEDYVVVFCP